MNIWIVNHYAIPPSMGGLVRHYYFSKYLQKKGHSVKIFTSSKIHNTDINMIKDNSLYKEEVMDGVEYTFVRSKDYKGNGIDRIINMIDLPFKMWKAMKSFYKKEKPDVIYTSSPDLFVAFFALLFGKSRKIPVVVEIRDFWPKSIVEYGKVTDKNIFIRILYKLEKWIYEKADRIVFTMEGWKNYFAERKIKIDYNKIEYINNGVDIKEFEENKTKFVVDDADLDNENTFKFVYMGSIRAVNNLQYLVDAARLIKQFGYNNIRILVYGDGTEREMLQKESEQNKLNVIFKGKVDKKYIPYILSKADVNVVNVRPSNICKYGSSWNKLYEYMASGKPVLSNVLPEYDLITKYRFGFAKKFGTIEEYAACMIKMSNLSKTEYSEMCKNAHSVVKDYDYFVLSEKVEHLLKKLSDEKRK